MPSFFIDDKEIEFTPGEDILTAALRHKVFVPHYCYHEALSRVATCRMCMVEVTDQGNGKPIPKLVTSCSTPAAPNMKITVQSSKVIEARKGVMEFLLVNHPLDCVICDQAGECTLQDFSFQYGTGHSIVEHEKRVYGQREIGSFLHLERNRCIHCTRCVRFTQEITGTSEMGTFGRGHQLTVDTFVDHPLSDPFQGNLADICPVGAITLSDFRFRKRVWHLEAIPTVCEGCATGCNVDLYVENNQLYRLKPRYNPQVNDFWMCDYGRIGFHKYNVTRKASYKGAEINLKAVQTLLKSWLQEAYFRKKRFLILDSGHSTLEEAEALQQVFQRFFPASLYAYPKQELGEHPQKGEHGVSWMQKFISPAKAPNLKGLETLGLTAIELNEWKKALLSADYILALGELPAVWFEGIKQPQELIRLSPLIGNEKNFAFCIPALHSYEKTGSFINRQGYKQAILAGVLPEKNVWNALFFSRFLHNTLAEFEVLAGASQINNLTAQFV